MNDDFMTEEKFTKKLNEITNQFNIKESFMKKEINEKNLKVAKLESELNLISKNLNDQKEKKKEIKKILEEEMLKIFSSVKSIELSTNARPAESPS